MDETFISFMIYIDNQQSDANIGQRVEYVALSSISIFETRKVPYVKHSVTFHSVGRGDCSCARKERSGYIPFQISILIEIGTIL